MQKDNTLMNLQDVIADVKTFCDSYKIEVSGNPTTDLSRDAIFLRHRLMEEENNEYLEAAEAGDLVEIADALGDQLYILCGTILSHGMQHVIIVTMSENGCHQKQSGKWLHALELKVNIR